MKIKLPSVSYLRERTLDTFNRFPTVVTIAVIGTLTSIFLVHNEKYDFIYLYRLINFVLCLIMAVFSTLSLFIFSERNNLSKKSKYLLHIPVFILLTMYYFTLPTTKEEYSYFIAEFMNYAQYNVSLVMIVTFIAFVNRKKSLGIWNFNFKLLERLAFTWVYSVTLFAGLSTSFFAIDKLLEIKVPNEIYPDLWILVVGMFSSTFFLAGIPKDYDKLEEENFSTIYLKFFSQFILLPISLIYMAILYMYALKIILAWDLPNGGVSALILGCAGSGIISFLALYPLQEKSENEWIKIFSKYFYILFLPLIGMLFIAVNRRVSEYGITEPRYFLSLIAFWLLGISLYFIFSKIKDIKYIPISIALLSFLTSFGPWSAYNVSLNSQLSRLEKLLVKNNVLFEGKVKNKDKKEVGQEELNDISSIIHYLNDYGKIKELDRYFNDPVKADAYKYNNPQKYMEAMGIKYIYPQRFYSAAQNAKSQYLYYSIKYNSYNYTNISDYDYLLKTNLYRSFKEQEIKINSESYKITFDEGLNLKINKNNILLIEIPCSAFFKGLAKKYPYTDYNIEKEDLTLNIENEKVKAKVIFSTLSFNKEKDKIDVTNAATEIFIGFK
ncbi:MAG: DUF4153 domain-containing protein [Candidatus Sericytochromatia bacterium]